MPHGKVLLAWAILQGLFSLITPLEGFIPNVHNIKATQKSMLFTVNMTVKFCLQAWNAVMTVIT